ncbi:MAG: glucuronosyltransferase [Deltaproteobacteria bacterium]|nr:glucuronosyltransferase [Deltaproteobacteria bacterium]
MIFVTVGANTPFDRMVRCVDAWAAARGRRDVFAQIGETEYRPAHLEWTALLSPLEFRERLRQADVIVAHAGMGTILSALEAGVPLLVMPRRAALREQRNDHQLATARRLRERGLVHVADDEAGLTASLDSLGGLEAPARIEPVAPPPLVERLRRFIRSG